MDSTLSSRYRSHDLNSLVQQLEEQAKQNKANKIKKIQEDRRIHRSCIQINKTQLEQRKSFNNKTKEGGLFTPQPPQAPYLFIPKYKNQTFIMPDRVFAKGQAGKRFHIKMKDTFVYSFRDPETAKLNKLLKKEEKQRTISGRKMDELNRILDQNDGRLRAKKSHFHLKNRKIFQPASAADSEIFSVVEPMMEPRQSQIFLTKKINLTKTFGPNQWRPASRQSSFGRKTDLSFSKTAAIQSFVSHR